MGRIAIAIVAIAMIMLVVVGLTGERDSVKRCELFLYTAPMTASGRFSASMYR
jgi:hypothetical protein